MYIQKKKSVIKANEAVDLAPEATELLFEAEDVATVVAEATGEDVAVNVSDEGVEFTVGTGEEAEVFFVEPEGDEELLEASTKKVAEKSVKASTRARHARAARTVRRVRC